MKMINQNVVEDTDKVVEEEEVETIIFQQIETTFSFFPCLFLSATNKNVFLSQNG